MKNIPWSVYWVQISSSYSNPQQGDKFLVTRQNDFLESFSIPYLEDSSLSIRHIHYCWQLS
jgi:hypothetical protein